MCRFKLAEGSNMGAMRKNHSLSWPQRSAIPSGTSTRSVSEQKDGRQDTKNDRCLKGLLKWKLAMRVNMWDSALNYKEI